MNPRKNLRGTVRSTPAVIGSVRSNIRTSEWELNGNLFGYACSVDVSEQSGYSLSNHQVKVKFGSGDPVFTHAQSNGEDLRFALPDNTVLDHYIKSWDATNESATVWVKVPSLSANGSQRLYCYYGNSNLASASDPEATYYVYDMHGNGYSGTLYGSARVLSGSPDYIELTDTTDSQQGSIRYDSLGTPSPGFYADWEWYTGDGTDADAQHLFSWWDVSNRNPAYEDPNAYGVAFGFNDHDDAQFVNWNSQTGDIAGASVNPATSSWETATAYAMDEGGGTLRYYLTSSLGYTQGESTWSNSSFPPGNAFGWAGRTGGANNHHWVRRMTVRKWTNPQPNVTVNSEEGVA